MKTILCSLLLIITTTLFSQKIDVLNYTYNVELSDSSDVVRCTALVKLRAASPLELDLADNMKVTAVWNERKKKKLTYKHSSNKINIPLRDTGEITVGITYSGVPRDGL